MNKGILMIIMSIFWTQLYCQNVDIGKLVMEANDFDKKGNIEQSIKVKQALIKLLPDEIIGISLSKSFALINELDSSFYYLDKYALNSSNIEILTSPDFYLLISDPRWSKLEKVIVNNYVNKTKSELNIDYTKELLRLKLIDQSLFYRIELAEKRGDVLMSSYLWHEKSKVKKESYEKLKSLISEYGYPSDDTVTREGTEAAFLIIQHLENLSEQESYLPLIKKYGEEGKISMQHYAYLIDRINMRNNLPQVYGTQMMNNTIYKIEDLEKVNNLRKSVGLPELTKEELPK